ncbi:MAG: hypothetical protein NC489_31715 [Ruminococcus flavefaciens]|nr:hypothetical protein [Ruminococcus flavefaciens]
MTLYEEMGLLGAGLDTGTEEDPAPIAEMPITHVTAETMQECVAADVRVELIVQLPDGGQTSWEAALEGISAAFRNADIGWWMEGAKSWFDDDIIWIDLTVRVTDTGSADAVASCARKLECAGREMLKSGYRMADRTCSMAGKH